MSIHSGLDIQKYDELIRQLPEMAFKARMVPLYRADPELGMNQPEEIEEARAIERTDTGTILGVVGSSYVITQHSDELRRTFDAFDSLGMSAVGAGTLEGGKKVFVQFRRGNILIAGDSHDTYLTASFSYDGASASKYLSTCICIVCQNTYRMATMGDSAYNEKREGREVSYAARHTQGASQKLEEIRTAITALDSRLETYSAFAERAAKQPVTPAYARAMLDVAIAQAGSLHPKSYAKSADELAECLRNETFMQAHEGTALGVWYAVTDWADHYVALRVRGDNGKAAERTFSSRLIGRADTVKQTVYSFLSASIEKNKWSVPEGLGGSSEITAGGAILDDLLASEPIHRA